MLAIEVIRKVIPDASVELADHILWGMTPYPFECNVRILYKAASIYKRSNKNNIALCDWCYNKVEKAGDCCKSCLTALSV